MYLGRLVELSSNTELFERPLHPYTRALLDAVPVPDPEGERQIVSLAGEVPSILTPPSGCAFHPRCRYAESQCENTLPEKRVLVSTTVACHRAAELKLY